MHLVNYYTDPTVSIPWYCKLKIDSIDTQKLSLLKHDYKLRTDS